MSSASVISGDSIGDVTVLLGQLYLEGRGVLLDTSKAIEMFYKANSEGDKFSYYLIGESFRKGWGTEIDTYWCAIKMGIYILLTRGLPVNATFK